MWFVNRITETKQLQLEYWEAFRKYAIAHATYIKATKPLPQHWMNIALGRSSFELVAIAAAGINEIRAEVMIHNSQAKAYFTLLETEKAEIEAEFGQALGWCNLPEKKSCKIQIRCAADLSDRSKWQEQHQWLVQNLDKLHKTFSHRVKRLSLDSFAA
jgi:hypothetical protein